MRRSAIASLVALLFLLGCSGDAENVPAGGTSTIDAAQVIPFTSLFDVTSPDENLRIELGIDELGRARYRVLRGQTVVLRDSTFGLETSAGSFSKTTDLRTSGPAELVTDTFDLPHGKARQGTVQARTQTFTTENLAIEVWVADTGVAFRYRVDRPGESFMVDWERTSFAVPVDSRTWLQEHDAPGAYTPAYERLRSRESAATNPGRSQYGWTFPALFEHEGTWTLITETALADGAAGSHLSPAATNAEFLLDFANRGEGNGVGDPRPQANESWTSPWRLIITSTDLGDVVESDLVRHLSPATTADFSWVEPGRVSWSWWSDHDSSKNADAMEPFIDLAAEMGWEYSLIDANWNTIAPERIEELVAYAEARQVGLFFWYNSGGPNNAVTEAPRDLMADPATRRAELARLRDLGVKGIKVDFFHSDKPDTIQLYRDIMSDAADAQLMVHFHGSTVPRGWQREFPNLLTMEAVRGAEIYTFDATFQRFAPWQNTVLPFTRNVVGPMDYTPIILGDEVRRITTNGHELALAVVFESALLHLVDTPQAYLTQPAEVVDLLSTVPTVWDETQLIEGRPGSSAVIARRHADEWWIGAINATDETVTSVVDLEALGLAAGVELTQVCDNADWSRLDAETYLDPEQYAITTDLASASLRLDLVSNGGCLVRLRPQPQQ